MHFSKFLVLPLLCFTGIQAVPAEDSTAIFPANLWIPSNLTLPWFQITSRNRTEVMLSEIMKKKDLHSSKTGAKNIVSSFVDLRKRLLKLDRVINHLVGPEKSSVANVWNLWRLHRAARKASKSTERIMLVIKSSQPLNEEDSQFVASSVLSMMPIGKGILLHLLEKELAFDTAIFHSGSVSKSVAAELDVQADAGKVLGHLLVEKLAPIYKVPGQELMGQMDQAYRYVIDHLKQNRGYHDVNYLSGWDLLLKERIKEDWIKIKKGIEIIFSKEARTRYRKERAEFIAAQDTPLADITRAYNRKAAQDKYNGLRRIFGENV